MLLGYLFLLPVLVLLRFIFGFFLLGGLPAKGVSWTEAASKWHHPLRDFGDNIIKSLGTSDETLYDDFNRTLDAILIPRVPGTEGHEEVRQFILQQMNALGWFVEQDQFNDYTPHGKKSFSNIIATVDPAACRQLVVACHYDSLYNREFTFMGATDSAVPCAMMIHMAKLLNPLLQEPKNKRRDVTLQLVFFDGEEAFRKWSRTDSLYGSRHLAKKWNDMKPFTKTPPCTDKDYVSQLDRMDVMVLLDLIGTANPTFYSYFLDTHQLYNQLVDAEYRLNSLKLLESHPPETGTQYFQSRSTLAFVEDDHIPFMKRGVPIIHVIPSPFPPVWHRESDDRASLHHPTINNLNKILRVFVSRYLHLEVPQKPLTL